MERQQMKKKLWISAGCFALTSLAVLLIPLSGDEGMKKAVGYLIGVLFWLGIAGGSFLYFWLYREESKTLKKSIPKGKIPFGFRFFSNRFAAVWDGILIVTLCLNIYCIRTLGVNQILELAALFLFTTSVFMHFLLNGRVFQYITQNKGKGVQEK